MCLKLGSDNHHPFLLPQALVSAHAIPVDVSDSALTPIESPDSELTQIESNNPEETPGSRRQARFLLLKLLAAKLLKGGAKKKAVAATAGAAATAATSGVAGVAGLTGAVSPSDCQSWSERRRPTGRGH